MIIEENGRYKEEVFAMWQRNFHDPAPYADFYFTEVYGRNEILLNLADAPENSLQAMTLGEDREERDGMIRGMLHLNPYELLIGKDAVDAHYIVGVATDEEFRRQGVMRELLTDTFSRLRRQGEMLTYLMPADEAYYIPFDFRFGMCQLEQELECFNNAKKPESFDGLTFQSSLPEDLERVCQKENALRAERFVIGTKITPAYLLRMEKEARSDFARLIMVYRDGSYLGRFVMGAENDCLVLSQIVCADSEAREDFLGGALYYCEQEYHYGRYQLVLDETWRDVLYHPGNYSGARILPVKEKKIIMFRILNLEKLGAYLTWDGAEERSCRLYVQDAYLKEQEGVYLLRADKRKVTISAGQPETGAADGGSIAIGALTELIFGKKEERSENLYGGLTPEGKQMLESLRPLRPVCIQEIV